LRGTLIPALQDRVNQLAARDHSLELLADVGKGLYEELDKLSKKAPAETITDLALRQVNTVIQETKALNTDDPYVHRLSEFVAAGDNPQHRDVVIVLKQLLLGQARLKVAGSALLESNRSLLDDAKGVACAIELRLQGVARYEIGKSILEYNQVSVSPFWQTGGYDYHFNFNRLIGFNPTAHFQPR
jgi:hypothetical protein